MLDVEVFVGELGSVDGDSACAVVVREVTALGHEILDHSVEGAALVRVLLLVVAGTKRSEVLSGLRHIIRIQLKIIVVARGVGGVLTSKCSSPISTPFLATLKKTRGFLGSDTPSPLAVAKENLLIGMIYDVFTSDLPKIWFSIFPIK